MKLQQKNSKGNFNEYKIKTIESNTYFKRESFRKIDLIKNKFINNLNNSRLDENGRIGPKQKISLLMYHFAVLSLCKREEILPLMDRLDIGKYVIKFFVEAEEIFNKLDEFQEDSSFIIDYKQIAHCYLDYINPFFMKQLIFDLDIESDFKKHLNNLSKHQERGSLNKIYDDLFTSSFIKAKKIEQVNPNFKIPVYEDNIIGTFKKFSSFYNKIGFANMYLSIYENNKTVLSNNFSEKDFNIFFYKFLEIIVKDKSDLVISADSQSKYGKEGNDRYKSKWMDSFLKTWRK